MTAGSAAAGTAVFLHFSTSPGLEKKLLWLRFLWIFLVVERVTGDMLRSGATGGRHLPSATMSPSILSVSINKLRVPRKLPSLLSVCGEKKLFVPTSSSL